MKLIGIIFLSILLAKGCNDGGEIEKVSISYEASTRGFYRIIKIEEKKLFVASTRGEKPEEVKISKKDWSALVDAFKEINLDELPNFKAPSQKRMVDAAPHASFKVMKEGRIYESQVFDHGNPPLEIELFINKLISLTLKQENDD